MNTARFQNITPRDIERDIELAERKGEMQSARDIQEKATTGVCRMSLEDYLAAPGVSKHGLDHFTRSPLEYWQYEQGLLPDERTPALEFGRIWHAAVLEKRYDFHIRPDTYGDGKPWHGGANYCKQWKEEHADKPILSDSEASYVQACVEAVWSDSHASTLLSNGEPELSMFVDLPELGLRLKARPDWTGSVFFVELKSTTDASTPVFSREILNRRYHLQAAINVRIAAMLGLPKRPWVFIAVEKGPLPRINVRELDPRALDKGCEILEREVEALAECKRLNRWPSYTGLSASIPMIDLPEWVYGGTLDLEINGQTVEV